MYLTRTLPALLLGGWLSMLPPLDKDLVPDDTASIAKWNQTSTHDTAKACQDELLQALAPFSHPRHAVDKLAKELYTHARCVPAEQIYPPAQPTPNPTP